MEIIIVGGILFWIFRKMFFNSSPQPKIEVSVRAGRESTPEEDEREERRWQAEEKDRQRTFRIGMSQINTDIGLKEPACPSCGVIRDKFPSGKAKCRKCGEFIYKRVRPWDKVSVLLSEKQIKDFEKEVEKYRFIKRHCITNYPYYERELKKLNNTEQVDFVDVVTFKYEKDFKRLLNHKIIRLYSFETHDLVEVYHFKSDTLKILELSLQVIYANFCSVVAKAQQDLNKGWYDSQKEFKKDLQYKIDHDCYDNNLVRVTKELGYSLGDVKRVFYEMDTTEKVFSQKKDYAWDICIEPFIKREWDKSS